MKKIFLICLMFLLSVCFARDNFIESKVVSGNVGGVSVNYTVAKKFIDNDLGILYYVQVSSTVDGRKQAERVLFFEDNETWENAYECICVQSAYTIMYAFDRKISWRSEVLYGQNIFAVFFEGWSPIATMEWWKKAGDEFEYEMERMLRMLGG